jgi:peptidoglycan hydrolase CwlO-like protein
LTTTRRSRAARVRLVAALVTAGLFAHPATSAAFPGQEAPSGTDDGGYSADAAGGPGAGQVEVAADPLKGSSEDLDETLSTLGENLDEQLGELESARNALAETDAQLGDIRDAIEVTEGRIAELESQSDEVVIDAFINPPTEDSLDTLTADSLSEATIKQSILDTQADANADVLGDLASAREELEEQEAAESELEGAAQEARDSQEQELVDLQGAQSQQALFVAQVQLRLDKNLSEAEALKDVDPALAARIEDREGEVADQIQGVRDAEATRQALEALALQQQQAEQEAQEEAERLAAATPPPSSGGGGGGGGTTVGGATGSLATVACPGGGSITVDSALASGLTSLLAAASADGISYCGGGYRDPSAQIALREANCGTSYYAIYEAPSSSCSPPTARPGTSNHEQGLAIDFTCNGGGTIQSRSSSCFQWLDANAASYGLYNLPSEPWHWSNDGT